MERSYSLLLVALLAAVLPLHARYRQLVDDEDDLSLVTSVQAEHTEHASTMVQPPLRSVPFATQARPMRSAGALPAPEQAGVGYGFSVVSHDPDQDDGDEENDQFAYAS